MDDSAKSGTRLEVSVSFGRFENDALSWEKWSSFSPNKYLEEVGTLSTPGSVAQKKAYFEAHYKKIAARKAEELEQEKLTGAVKISPHVARKEDYTANSSENGIEFGLSSGEGSVEEVTEEACVTASTDVAIEDEAKDDDVRSSKGDEQSACTNGFVDAIISQEEIRGVAVAVESGTSAVEEAKDLSNVNVDNSELDVRKDEVVVGLETEKPPERKSGVGKSSVVKKENSKLNGRNIAQKVTPTKKERNLAGTKKKVGSPAAKPLQASTPKYSKPTSISTPVPAAKPKSISTPILATKPKLISTAASASQSLKRTVNGSAPLKSKNSLVGESKRAAPTSLHMSLSLGPADSSDALSMTRKSLIMERMGDKDIVRRAFKTFQNRTNGYTTDEKPSTVKHVSSTAVEPKMSSYHTPTKGNQRLMKDAEKKASQRSQSGTRSNPLPSKSHKSSALDKKNTIAFSPATGSKSDENAEKRKEFLKKLGAKSIAREAENAQLGAKSKVGI